MSTGTDGTLLRARAACALHRVLTRGLTLDQVTAERTLEPLERELLFGTARHYYSLAYRAATLLTRPLRNKDQDVWALLLIGLYQLLHLQLPTHAAVNSTAGAARHLKKPWATGVLNACLRTQQRSGTRALATLPRKGAVSRDEATFELPLWLLEQLRREYPAVASSLANALTGRAPMALRVKASASAALADELQALGLDWTTPFAPETWLLSEPVSVQQLPGYDRGLVSVQDAGAQLGMLALEQLRAALPRPKERLRWADFCAAPGGKLCHALERWAEEPQAVFALDASAPRLEYVARERDRLGLPFEAQSLKLAVADASTPDDWWDGTPYDLVLVDAPCSGTGTLRRHPDIKLLRTADDLPAQAELQQRLLSAAARVTSASGGVLYATCSLLEQENDAVVAAFLEQHPGWTSVPLQLPSGAPRQHGWQLLPTDPRTDGFYYAALKPLK